VLKAALERSTSCVDHFPHHPNRQPAGFPFADFLSAKPHSLEILYVVHYRDSCPKVVNVPPLLRCGLYPAPPSLGLLGSCLRNSRAAHPIREAQKWCAGPSLAPGSCPTTQGCRRGDVSGLFAFLSFMLKGPFPHSLQLLVDTSALIFFFFLSMPVEGSPSSARSSVDFHPVPSSGLLDGPLRVLRFPPFLVLVA